VTLPAIGRLGVTLPAIGRLGVTLPAIGRLGVTAAASRLPTSPPRAEARIR
jgi:hypothetical protein